MNTTERISRYLEHRIPYMIQPQSEGLDGALAGESPPADPECFAKSIPVSIDGRIFVAVIPARGEISIQRLRQYLGADNVRMATETEHKQLFFDCEEGAMPIFGSLYGVPVLIAHELTDHEEIAFNPGDHRHVVRIRLRDFLIMEKPYVCAREAILTGRQ